MKFFLGFVFFVFAGCSTGHSSLSDNEVLKGKVIGISDGDTFTLLTEGNNQEKIRLHGIDCPERKQAFGSAAKQKLSELIFRKEVDIQYKSRDRYRRIVAIVFEGDNNINEIMIRTGYAWHFKRYDDNAQWDQMEKNARANRLGLWSDLNPIPPWEWRIPKKG